MRIGRNAAIAFGVGVGGLLLGVVYPRPEEAAHLAAIFSQCGLVLVLYGFALGFLLLRRNDMAPMVSLVLTWLILPTAIGYVLSVNLQ